MAVGIALSDPPERDRRAGSAWRETWRVGVRSAAHALVLVDLPSTTILALSAAAAEVLAISEDGARTLAELTESMHGGDNPLNLLAAGAVETLTGKARLRSRRVGIDKIWWSARSVRTPDGGGDLALIGLDCLDANRPDALPTPIPPRVLGSETSAGEAVAVVTLDEQWLVSAVATGTSRPPESDRYPVVPIGAWALELVCPESRSSLLRSLALATTGARAGVPLRIRLWGDPQPRGVSAAVSMRYDDGGARFVLELHAIDEATVVTRAAELERRLRRIAVEIQGVELLESAGRQLHAVSDPRLRGLTARQLEIVSRLRHGERVPSIARSMFLAPSTVRNHLTTVFRRFGVNSQTELIEALRAQPE